jgi:hypothetical protein
MLLHGRVPQEGGLDAGVGRSCSIWPNFRIPIENLLTGKSRPEK